MHTLRQHLTEPFVFGHRTTPARFTRLGGRIVLCFSDDFKAHGNRLPGVLIQRGKEVDPLNIPLLAVIPVPTDYVVLSVYGFSSIVSSKISTPSDDCI